MGEGLEFSAADYGTAVAELLDLGGGGKRPMRLVPAGPESRSTVSRLKTFDARTLFPAARAPEGAMAGLFLYFSALDEAHSIAQDLKTPDGSYWHGIMHRQEPDPFNAGYWFRRAGAHPVFPELNRQARSLGFDSGRDWNPFQFVEFCEQARRRPGSDEENLAMRVQLVEWQLLFDYCAEAKKA